MKILIISRAFYPMNSPRSFRTTELVKEFCKLNHEVTLLTPYKPIYHNKLMKVYGFKIIDLGKVKENIFTNNNQGTLKNRISRFFEMFFEYPDILMLFRVKKKLRKLQGFDLMISIASPHSIHWGVAFSKNKKNVAKKWIADCGDPFMGLKLNRIPKMPYFKYFEKLFCENADFITVPVKGAIKAYYSEFYNKIKVIPQGFNFEQSLKGINKNKRNSILKFAYAGSFIPNIRDPRPLLEFLSKTDQDFRFIIYTNMPKLIEHYKNILNEKLIIREFIPRNTLLKELNAMDFLINISNGISEQVPSKLIDYAILEKPILSVNSQDLNEAMFNSFLNKDFSSAFKIENIDDYRIENVCKKFTDLVRN